MLKEEKIDQNLSDSYQLLIDPVVNVDEEPELLDHKTYQKTIRQALRDEKIAPHLKTSWLDQNTEANLLTLFKNTDQLQDFIEVTKTSLTTRNLLEGEEEEKESVINKRRMGIASFLTLISLGGVATSGWLISRGIGTDFDFQVSNGPAYLLGGIFGGMGSLFATALSSTFFSKNAPTSQGIEPCLEPGVKAAVTRKYDKQFLYNFFNTVREYNDLQSSEIGTHHDNTIGQLILEYAA